MLEIKNLIEISKYAGMREDLIQAGGGNTSVKINDKMMYIKSSGYQLSEMNEKTGYSKIDYKKIKNFFIQENNIFQKDEQKLLNDVLIEGNRPSIETFLHSLTKDKYTLHTHPTLVNVLTSRKDGMKILKKIFPESLIINYKTPGIFLAQELFKVMSSEEQKGDIIFLKNHGLIVTGNDIFEIVEKNEKVLKRLQTFLELDMKKYENSTKLYLNLKEILEGNIVYLSQNNGINNYLKKYGAENINYNFSPDSLVYCGKKILYLKKEKIKKQAEEHKKKYGQIKIMVYDGNVYITAPNIKKAKDIESVLNFNFQVLELNKGEKMDFLTETEQSFLLNWDSEKYRQKI